MKRIYLSPPHMSEQERDLMLEAFDSGWIAPAGPMIDKFEFEFAEKIGVKYATAVSNGTAALHLALIILGVKPGDEVLTSTFTFCASVNPIIYLGAKPVFIDSDSTSWNISPEILINEIERRAKLNKLPKAVIVVDIYGQCSDFDPILNTCKKYNIPVIDDATEALGAEYKGKKVGNQCDIAAFSFNGNKIITTSSGGMLVSDNEEFIKHAEFLSTQAKDPQPFYHHTSIGYNYRMSNILAAIGLGQLHVLDERVKRRREINAYYRRELAEISGVEFMPEADYGKHTFWLTTLTIDPAKFGKSAEDVRLHLEGQNIEARRVWKPMHQQPVYKHYEVVEGEVADKLFETGLCLPSGSSLSDEDLQRIVSTVKNSQS